MLSVSFLLALLAEVAIVSGAPAKQTIFDVQGHRGGRGETIENTLPSFAWGLIDGVTTLEMDNGITKDGVVVVWHDENIAPEKCKDTQPAVKDDPDFPYVGKYIANLTLAQIKTLDCGSQRLIDFPLQSIYPKTKISTLKELFEFVRCADPSRDVQFNIESKVDAQFPNLTRAPEDFVKAQYAEFIKSGFPLESITYQSFDWRTLVSMKKLEPRFPTAALASSATAGPLNGTTPWLAGLQLRDFPGDTLGVKLANAAHSIKADILSTSDIDSSSPVTDPSQPGYVPFTTKAMIDRAHEVGMTVKPWTVDRVNSADLLVEWGADGIITDYPAQLRRIIKEKGLRVAATRSEDRVLACLAKYNK